MPIAINGSGTVTGINAGGLPDASITSAELATNSVTTAAITDANVTPAKLSQPLTLETAKASTSGTAIEFTGIPSWVKRISILLTGVSTSGTSAIQIQLGVGTFQTSSYSCVSSNTSTSATNSATAFSAGFVIVAPYAAANTAQGQAIISLLDVANGIWTLQSIVSQSGTTSGLHFGSGSKTLSGTLDRIRITTVNGTDTFDAGSINILYEG